MSFFVDLLALAYLTICGVSGFRKGFLLSILAIVSVVCSYICSYLFGGYVGGFIENQYGMSNIASTVIGSMIVFIFISILFGCVKGFLALRKKKKEKEEGKGIALWSRCVGAGIKLLVGVIFVSVMLWGYNLLCISPIKKIVPSIDNSIASSVGKRLVAQGSYTIVNEIVPDKEKAVKIAYLISNPKESHDKATAIVEHPKFRTLINDPNFANDLLTGDVSVIENNSSFSDVINDNELMKNIKSLDIAPNINLEEYKDKFSKKMGEIGQKLKKLMDDPKISKHIKSLKDEGMLKAEKLTELIKDVRFGQIIDKVFTSDNKE